MSAKPPAESYEHWRKITVATYEQSARSRVQNKILEADGRLHDGIMPIRCRWCRSELVLTRKSAAICRACDTIARYL